MDVIKNAQLIVQFLIEHKTIIFIIIALLSSVCIIFNCIVKIHKRSKEINSKNN